MNLKQLIGMHLSLASAVAFGWWLFVPYLASLGFTQLDIMLSLLVFFSFTLPVMAVTRNWKIKNYLMFGLGMRALCFIMALWIFHPMMLLIIGMTFTFIITDYWAVFNALFEEGTETKNRAFLNSIVMGIIPLAQIILPVTAGFLADIYGFEWLFIAGFLMMLPGIYIARKAGNKRMEYDVFKAIKANPKIREVMFLEGFADGVAWGIPLVVTLQFVSSNLEFGGFFSYLGIVGAISALLLGKRSDKKGVRWRYIKPVMWLSAAALMIAGIANNLLVWSIALGATSFLNKLEWPFTWAMVTESSKDFKSAMIAREFWLNAGRMSSLLLAIGCLVFLGNVQLGLVIGSFGFLLFPYFMKKRRLG